MIVNVNVNVIVVVISEEGGSRSDGIIIGILLLPLSSPRAEAG